MLYSSLCLKFGPRFVLGWCSSPASGIFTISLHSKRLQKGISHQCLADICVSHLTYIMMSLLEILEIHYSAKESSLKNLIVFSFWKYNLATFEEKRITRSDISNCIKSYSTVQRYHWRNKTPFVSIYWHDRGNNWL